MLDIFRELDCTKTKQYLNHTLFCVEKLLTLQVLYFYVSACVYGDFLLLFFFWKLTQEASLTVSEIKKIL